MSLAQLAFPPCLFPEVLDGLDDFILFGLWLAAAVLAGSAILD